MDLIIQVKIKDENGNIHLPLIHQMLPLIIEYRPLNFFYLGLKYCINLTESFHTALGNNIF